MFVWHCGLRLMFVCISSLVNIDVGTCVCCCVHWLHRFMTRDGGTPCGCNGKSLVVVDVIYIYIMLVWHCGLRLMFVCISSLVNIDVGTCVCRYVLLCPLVTQVYDKRWWYSLWV